MTLYELHRATERLLRTGARGDTPVELRYDKGAGHFDLADVVPSQGFRGSPKPPSIWLMSECASFDLGSEKE